MAQIHIYDTMSRTFAVHGQQMYLECAGAGQPVLLFEAGARNASTTWNPIWSAVTAMTRACRYDRAGLGQSTGVDSESATLAARNLEALLRAAHIRGPYVLVGHSLGSVYARMFASRNPEDVVGMVSVDGLNEHQRTRVIDLPAPHDSGQAVAWRNYVELQRRRQRVSETGVDSLIVEMEGRTLGDIPFIVVSAGHPIGAPPAGFPPGMAERMEDVWLQGQRELVRLSSRGRQVLVEDAGHNVHRDRPDVVLNAIRDVLLSAGYSAWR